MMMTRARLKDFFHCSVGKKKTGDDDTFSMYCSKDVLLCTASAAIDGRMDGW